MVFDLSLANVVRVIIHDLPRPSSSGEPSEVDLSEAPSELDDGVRQFILGRMVNTLQERNAFSGVFAPATGSVVPAIIGALISGTGASEADFVTHSQSVALALHNLQNRAVSAGILAVVDLKLSGTPGLCLLKLDRRRAIQLRHQEIHGNRTIDLRQINDLIMHDQLRVQKAAIFLSDSDSDDSTWIKFADPQHNDRDAGEAAQFWTRFLGIKTAPLEPKAANRRFKDFADEFINENAPNAMTKLDWQLGLQTYMKSQEPTMNVGDFADQQLPASFRDSFTIHMRERGVPQERIPKDDKYVRRYTSVVRLAMDTGVYVMGSEEAISEHVEIEELENGRVRISTVGVRLNVDAKRNT